LFIKHLEKRGLLEKDDLPAIEKEVAGIVQEAVDFAEAANWEPVEELTRYVYTEGSLP
jgi:TPP-dependent pyruvate/acetoin dehydrogenase alpha subunit